MRVCLLPPRRHCDLSATPVWVNNRHRVRFERVGRPRRRHRCATNPTYGSVLLRGDLPLRRADHRLYVAAIEPNPYKAADEVYQRITRLFMERLHTAVGVQRRRLGFVTMQDCTPRLVEDPDFHRGRRTCGAASSARNYLARIPVIEAGMEAMRRLVGLNIPMCATECFAVSQAVAMCEVYEEGRGRHRQHAAVLHHAHHRRPRRRPEPVGGGERNRPSPELVRMAGSIVARKQYKVRRSAASARSSSAAACAGAPLHRVRGRRRAHHDELVDLRRTDPGGRAGRRPHPLADDPADVAELRAKIPRFATAYDDDGLTPAEFTEYPALVRFRNYFIDGCEHLDGEIAKRHAAAAVA